MAPNPRRARRLLWIAGGALLLLGAALLVARLSLFAYLRSESFRTLISRETSRPLQARGEWDPLQFSGSSIYSERFTAAGSERAFFSELAAEQVRANLDLGKVWQKTWSVSDLSISHLQLRLADSRAKANAEAEASREIAPSPPARTNFFLPDKAELRHAAVREAEFRWNDGALTKTALDLTPDGAAWNVNFTGGTLTHGALPPLRLETAQLRYRAPTLFITAAELTAESGEGRASVSGEVEADDHLDLQAKITGFPVGPLLPADWRARLTGTVEGELKVASRLPAAGWPIEGSLALKGGELVALPVLDQIAVFTRTAQFRRLVITRGTAKFTQRGSRLDVRDFHLESQGLLRVEGAASIISGEIDGLFQVGVAPSALQWIPGSQERVFTAAHDGYVWTAVRLTGPVRSPREDLTARLVAAAGAAVLDQAGQRTQEGVDAASGLIKSVLDPLLGR